MLRFQLVRKSPGTSRGILTTAVDRMALSARAAHRLMRVARTIADLADEEKVGPGVMAEAVGFRAEC
ncbi:MAG: hypothetical protein GY937_08655 [bacterium]|nr:hypothetical protein [bacterium]